MTLSTNHVCAEELFTIRSRIYDLKAVNTFNSHTIHSPSTSWLCLRIFLKSETAPTLINCQEKIYFLLKLDPNTRINPQLNKREGIF